MVHEYKRQSRTREIMLSLLRQVVVASLFLFLAILLGRSVWRMYAKLAEASQGEAEAKAQQASLTQQRDNLAAAVDLINSPQGVEAELRQRYGLAKPGEGEIQIVVVTPTTTEATSTPPTFFKRVWNMLKVW